MATITTVDNALDSLRRFPGELQMGEGPLALKGALYWGWHAVTMLAHHRLRPARETFDQWFWDYLVAGEQDFDVDRDARWGEQKRLGLLELLDVLSEEELSVLEPRFFHGWQDRTTRCRTLRRRVSEVLGTSLGEEQRNDLLLLLATYHRLLRLAEGVEIEAAPIRKALPSLIDLVDDLIDRGHDHSAALLEAVEACREALE